MHQKLVDMKKSLKEQAEYIKSQRSIGRKFKAEGNGFKKSEIDLSLKSYSLDYRVLHIVYCEMRGRKLEEIENSESRYPWNFSRKYEELKKKYFWTEEEIAAYKERKASYEALRSSKTGS